MLIEFDETAATASAAVDRLRELDRVMSRLHAVQADLLVTAADPRPQQLEVWVRDDMSDAERRLLIEDPIRDELACALRRSSGVMQDLIDDARLLAGPLRLTWQALHDGAITMAHARIVIDAARRLPEEVLEEFQPRVLPRAAVGTLVATRRAVRRAELSLDREGAERRRRQAKATRDVWLSHEADGMSLLIARMTTEQAYACTVQIDAAGFDRAYASDAKAGLTFGEHRVEALAAMILGGDGATAAPIRAHVNVTIPLDVLVGVRDGTADLDGAGAVNADAIRDLLEAPDCSVLIRRLVTDPMTGHLLDYGRTTYAIPRRLREFIMARDKTCRFPGCNRRADLCEIDHAVPWHRGGTTSPHNCGLLCKRHHQLKTHGGWHIIESRADGSCVWRSPQGRLYESGPPPYD